ncbi:MAG: beta-ketoacyl synthase N-terminal-like domain-containing protein [Desulfotignum sp.]|nr:beta-ketoacyl synthase N-terminal-like domain-containing protein [Desulfotignum sp.]
MFRLSGKSVLDTPYKAFGRMDPFSKLGFSAIAFAMADAGFSPISSYKDDSPAKQTVAAIAESATGCLDTDFSYQATLSGDPPHIPSPALFAYTLPSCFLGEAAIYYGLAGEAYMIETIENTGLTALSFAMDSLDTGNCKAAVCGICNLGPGTALDGTGPAPGALFLVLGKEPSPSVDRKGNSSLPLTITRQITNGDRFYLGENEVTELAKLIQKDIT